MRFILGHAAALSILLFALAAWLPSTEAARPRRGKLCSSNTAVNATREAELASVIAGQRIDVSAQRRAPRIIRVYFHVIHSGSAGKIPASAINAQMKVLNNDYAQANYQFRIVNVSYTNNTSWFTTIADQTSPAHFAMKRKLYRGGKGDLNLYTARLANQLLGFATFPWDYADGPYLDGVVIHTDSLPTNSSTLAPYNLGRTATHEIGHWLGLYHPFQGDSCSSSNPGDYVGDTPPQSTPTFGCPARKDSCTSRWGLDSISSFLDYTDDACMQKFTVGQRQRMQALSSKYRGI